MKICGSLRQFGRVINFSAGPCALPLSVLEKAQSEFTDWQGSGMGVMEMSHRGKEYTSIFEKTVSDFRELLSIPQTHEVLIFQGGASLQFGCIPLNLAFSQQAANYVSSGVWSFKALQECQKFFQATEAATSQHTNYDRFPDYNEWNINLKGAYFHYCSNETIHGVEWTMTQNEKDLLGDIPVVCDMSSNFMTQPVDWKIHDIVYGGAQKNLGPAGATVVVVRKDFLTNEALKFPFTPTMMDWQVSAKNGSMYNTPTTYSIYVMGLFLEYVKENGGIAFVEQLSADKSKLIYELIENSNGFYKSPVKAEFRSRVNIPFLISEEDLLNKFFNEAAKNGLVSLKGHRSVGGGRVSLYNAITLEETQRLVDFMEKFRVQNC